MAISNGYADRDQMKTFIATSITLDTDNDLLLDRAVEAASRAIDQYCGRVFYDAGSSAKTFVGDDPYDLTLPDFQSVTTVKTDTTDDGTFDTTWAASDYQAEPLNPENGHPYTRLVAVDDELFPTGSRRANIQVTATWGWAAVPTDVVNTCLELAVEKFKRKDAALGIAGFNEFGAVRISGSDLRILGNIHHLRRITVGAVG